MFPLYAHELRYIGKADLNEEERAARVKEMHEAMRRQFFPEDKKDAPIIRIHVDGKYDPDVDYRQDYPRRKKPVSE